MRESVQRIQEEEHMQLHNELIHVIGETIADTIVTMNQFGYILSVNPTVVSMLGYSVQECIGIHIHQLIPTLSLHLTKKVIQTFAIRKNQSKLPVDVQLRTATHHKQRLFVCSIRDVTERQQAEEDCLRRIFNATPCLMELRSLIDKRYLTVNESWLRYTGRTYDEILHKTEDEIQYILDTDGFGEAAISSSDLQQPVKNARIRYWTRSSEMREALLATERVEIHGEPCLLSIITDITKQVSFEQEIKKFSRLNIMTEMAAGIIHEIRNPMATVRGFLQILKDKPSAEYIDIMIEELDRTHNIITEFLSVAKIHPTQLTNIQLNDIVQSLFPLIQAKAMVLHKTARIELGNCPSLPLDEQEIRQLILHLALNGLEAMSEKGVLTIRTYMEDEDAVLEIEDEGAGIPRELLEKIGTPFFSTKANGIGIGLSVCHGIAARHHALLQVKTSEYGTRVLVRFPTTRQQA